MKWPLLYCLIFLLIVGCKKNSINSVNQKAVEIFPNKVGDTWLYLVNDTLVNRNTPKDSTATQYYLKVSVIDSIQLQGGIRANVWVYIYPDRTDTNYVFQKGDTVRFVDINQTIYSIYAKQYIIPITLYNSWQYSTPSFNDIRVDLQSNIIVGQNYFDNSFHLYGNAGMPDAGFIIDEWIENNVGLVKRHFNPANMLIDPRHVTAWSIISYHLE